MVGGVHDRSYYDICCNPRTPLGKTTEEIQAGKTAAEMIAGKRAGRRCTGGFDSSMRGFPCSGGEVSMLRRTKN